MSIQIIHMAQVPKDVSIDVVGTFNLGDEYPSVDNIHALYDTIKNRAIQHVRRAIKENEFVGRQHFNYIVEMEENDEGLPTANIFKDGAIDEKFFATREAS